MRSALYTGTVHHRRMGRVEHDLSYKVFALLLDLDELATLDRSLKWFGHNRRAPLSFHDADHGPGDGTPMRAWIEGECARAGIALDGGRILGLCYPRLWGYVFNPLTVWYCHDAAGDLRALLYEVNNTFGDRHGYLIPVETQDPGGVVRQSCAKTFHVSPFIPVEGTYRFKVAPPGETLELGITLVDPQGKAVLHAAFDGARSALTDRALRTAVIRHPLMTVKVLAGIHWEALKLWRKGARYHPRPPPPEPLVELCQRAEKRLS